MSIDELQATVDWLEVELTRLQAVAADPHLRHEAALDKDWAVFKLNETRQRLSHSEAAIACTKDKLWRK